MKKLLDNLSDLIKVKTLVTLSIIALFCTLAIKGDISSDNVTVIVGTVIAFYFGTVTEKKNGGEK